jgi:hypothetical protein
VIYRKGAHVHHIPIHDVYNNIQVPGISVYHGAHLSGKHSLVDVNTTKINTKLDGNCKTVVTPPGDNVHNSYTKHDNTCMCVQGYILTVSTNYCLGVGVCACIVIPLQYVGKVSV